MIRLAGLIFTAGFFVFFAYLPAQAQSGNTCVTTASCGWYSFDSGCIPALPAGAPNCQTTGPWSVVCEVVTTNCGAPPRWCPTCGQYISVAAQPINLTNGNTYIQQTDVRIPGLGGGLNLERT